MKLAGLPCAGLIIGLLLQQLIIRVLLINIGVDGLSHRKVGDLIDVFM